MTSLAIPAPGLTLGVLGEFALSVSGQPVELCRSAQRLLAYLVVQRGRPASRATTAERLWDGADLRRASSSLRSTLWRLPRPQSRPLVVCTGTHLRLAPEVAVDLWTSERTARSVGSEERDDELEVGESDIREALSLDLLPAWYDEWLLVEQEAYRQVRLHALEALSARLCELGRHQAALLAALAAVRAEPLRESAHRRVVSVHLAEGNAAEALRQYQTYRRLLADELGLAPSPEIRRLVGPLLGRPMDSGRRGPDNPVTPR